MLRCSGQGRAWCFPSRKSGGGGVKEEEEEGDRPKAAAALAAPQTEENMQRNCSIERHHQRSFLKTPGSARTWDLIELQVTSHSHPCVVLL
jgi:hypothetical protein